ncbi:NAD(P)/FAD-dependent oxidoreductase [Deinococcus sp. SL84]|uniref:NAD(P)/FAD-dependent oxidoreductase n=1 Tax=Deinococcus sp. SL84 TaxID=2994663 RepID=UPI0022750A3A|nr:NAD(P)/FAD-dependent oxidoreductase [Deinococcus sp. SL84]MCY1704304.1 NAD(P)/FAD-dependent oxidoreductase [Deinococcus sp. SL84]
MSYDVLVIGGGYAGLTAALYAARGMCLVAVVLGGPPRNARGQGVHGLISRDGASSADLLAQAREELCHYGVKFFEGHTETVWGKNGDFTAALGGGEKVKARKLILATGVSDQLPERPEGLRELWGKWVHHCPHCYGYEVRDQVIAAYLPGAAFGPEVLSNWFYYSRYGEQVLICSDAPVQATDAERARLEEHGITLCQSALMHIEDTGEGARLHFADSSSADVAALYTGSGRTPNTKLARQLGCDLDEQSGNIKVDPGTNETSVPGVYAAGDVTGGNQVALAIASGSRAGMFVDFALHEEELPEWAREPQKK